VADGDVDDVHVVARQHGSHAAHEAVELVDGDEVLLQDVGVLLPRRRLQLGDVVARLVVAPHHGRRAVQPGVEDVLADLLAPRPPVITRCAKRLPGYDSRRGISRSGTVTASAVSVKVTALTRSYSLG
jgi:hypothetical protein